MTFHILMNQITTLFLSLNMLTTLSFDSEIVSFLYGGNKQDVFFEVTNNNKTIAIKPKIKEGLSNLLIITKRRKYYLNLDLSETKPHQFVEIKHGIINHALKSKIKNKSFELLEGDSSLLFINKKKRAINVNGIETSDKLYLSKGIPIIIDGERVVN